MTWLNSRLIPYISEKKVLPDTQVATQKDVQTRDLMSYLSSIKCWSNQNKTQIYAIKRDQIKGFDYLAPEGFYDIIEAIGLPDSIAKLDQAAQKDNNCIIRTAHGLTKPIIINGVTKQGGPLSPLKSTLTTSMGHHYLNDLLLQDPDALIISSTNQRKDDPHLSDDNLVARIGMTEATDDSYIFPRTLQSLQKNMLHMEQFQYAYGWLTQWSKAKAYVLNGAGPQPEKVTFESISTTSLLQTTFHQIPLIQDELEFLQVKVDDAEARFEQLKDIIEEYHFPRLGNRPPITLLNKIISQNIISRCRALLSLQPIKQTDADILDKKINRLVHDQLGFPFMPSPTILMLPIRNNGLGFPSIARINAGLATDRIRRDLNHHIKSYRDMARIMMADWTCSLNHCVYPISGTGLLTQTHSSRFKKIPSSWIIAQRVMSEHREKLSLPRTDRTEVLTGDVSLSHYISIFNHHNQTIQEKIDGNVMKSLRVRGITLLRHVGMWKTNRPKGKPSIELKETINLAGWTAAGKQNLSRMQIMLSSFEFHWLDIQSINLTTEQEQRQVAAEHQVCQIALLSGLQPSPHIQTEQQIWASDGSMVPASAGLLDKRSVTTSVTGPTTLVAQVSRISAFITHGELAGITVTRLNFG
ncbi:uncharacterized protein C8R40DRAFT_1170604 [Lentinula edodes]|uniref:uncharacterized protein n=1 Tax=Lentinula edodes TaxID=5353 RepID=UPI001E8DC5D3|nr:uncharacterized protein C8R40DRAFT_1170604 [Lentinula edodes]KAH7875505.1 hypothetical protein C8R40DRAFT_1170604 [Lentinula edodes]